MMMKHRVLIATALAALLFVACGGKGDDPADDPNAPQPVAGSAFMSDGSSSNVYSVSPSIAVRFSKGNLQYCDTTHKWRFAQKQYEVIGYDNQYVDSAYNGWIDLFGWGTSGWNSGAEAYHPWDTVAVDQKYAPGNNLENDLVGACVMADWGVANYISNGGDQQFYWRTLTHDEWLYLLGDSEKRDGKWGLATIDSTYRGLVILPDYWVIPSSLSFNYGSRNGWNTNSYTIDEWALMELNGAIFLPTTGYRNVRNVQSVNAVGNYWSSTHYRLNYAYDLYFRYNHVDVEDYDRRRYGFAVRLVRNS